MRLPSGPRRPVRRPLFCPRKECPYHDPEAARKAEWFTDHGEFFTFARGEIKRFRCVLCGKTCSTQTFSIDYWTHGEFDYTELLRALDTGAGLRHTGRYTQVSYRLVQNRVRRMARNCLAVMDAALSEAKLRESLALDGLESYLRSQYFPCSITDVVGSDSQFIYATVLTTLPRKGQMTALQRVRRAMIDALWRPPAGATTSDCASLLGDLAPLISEASEVLPAMTLYSDLHTAYPLALARVKPLAEALKSGRLHHVRIPSKAPRTTANPLFPVNYVDRQMRKNMSEHGRETVKQARESNCAMERKAIFITLHNYLTPHRVSDHAISDSEPTHAQVAGHTSRRVMRLLREMTTRRHVFTHLRGEQEWIRRIWQHEYTNPPAVNFKTGVESKCVIALQSDQMPEHFLA